MDGDEEWLMWMGDESVEDSQCGRDGVSSGLNAGGLLRG